MISIALQSSCTRVAPETGEATLTFREEGRGSGLPNVAPRTVRSIAA